MVRAGQHIESRSTGERVRFLRTAADTDGALLEFESWWPPGDRAGAHVHPNMEERWEVLAGRARFRIGDVEHEAGPGEAVVAHAGVAHRAFNPGPELAHLRMSMRPALDWEDFMVALFALDPRDGAGLRELLRHHAHLVRPS